METGVVVAAFTIIVLGILEDVLFASKFGCLDRSLSKKKSLKLSLTTEARIRHLHESQARLVADFQRVEELETLHARTTKGVS